MKLKSSIAYFEQSKVGEQTIRGVALDPEYQTYSNGDQILSFNELFRIKLVQVARVVRDVPSSFDVVSTRGDRVTLRPLTVAAYRRYIKPRQQGGPSFESQADLEAYYRQEPTHG